MNDVLHQFGDADYNSEIKTNKKNEKLPIINAKSIIGRYINSHIGISRLPVLTYINPCCKPCIFFYFGDCELNCTVTASAGGKDG